MQFTLYQGKQHFVCDRFIQGEIVSGKISLLVG